VLAACDKYGGAFAAATYWGSRGLRALDDDYSKEQFVADLAIGPGIVLGAPVAFGTWIVFTKDPVGQIKDAGTEIATDTVTNLVLGPLAGPVTFARWLFD
jgi:hypothetical protein